jgi:hypothetical protein
LPEFGALAGAAEAVTARPATARRRESCFMLRGSGED